jgi:exoribonuclease R
MRTKRIEQQQVLPGKNRDRLEHSVIERSPDSQTAVRDRQRTVESDGRAASNTALMIDDRSSRDLDDAFTVHPTRDGWRVQVVIAAAADLIPAGSADDARARDRVESKYLPRKTIPMLVVRLSFD